MQTSIFSVDVEDWFHVLEVESAPAPEDWAAQPSRVAWGLFRWLDLFAKHQVQVTCFFLGWIAEQHPELVREAHTRGHEIASHGHAHRLVHSMSVEQFYADARRSRLQLEDLIGAPVLGFRAPGFSVSEHNPWFFAELVRAGYVWDSSVFPGRHGHGGLPEADCAPHRILTPHGPLLEYPISVLRWASRSICFCGGGYLRLLPYGLIRRMSRQVLRQSRPVIYYVHPREADPAHPRLPMPWLRRFKSYVNLGTAYAKVDRILKDFPVTSFARYHADPTIDG